MKNLHTSRPGSAADFAQMRQDSEELLRAVRRARRMFGERTPASFGSLSELLDEVLPDDQSAEAAVARAVEIEPVLLTRLRSRKLDPYELPPLPLAELGQTLEVDRETFLLLMEADHQRYAGTRSHSRGTEVTAAAEEFRTAWARAALDLPEGDTAGG